MKRNDKDLYFWNIGGAGTIRCLNCNYKQDIVSFIHGFNWNKAGYQCEKCGKFHEIISYSDKISETAECNCEGHLSRSKPIFCPHCKMTKVTYQMSYIT